MLEVAVIADDLTGAADTGVQFCRTAPPVYLAAPEQLGGIKFPRDPQTISLHTDSRHLDPGAAQTSVRAAARALLPLQPRLIYKKIDSCLRGNVRVEVEALLDELNLDAAFIAPAYPAQGRTIVHGVHYLHGVPLAQTEMARDPITPVNKSEVARILAREKPDLIGIIDLAIYERGLQALIKETADLLGRGYRIIVLDAKTQDHLAMAASLVLDEFPRCFLVGSAGLAAGLASNLELSSEADTPKLSRSNFGPFFVCGSASARLAEQVDKLATEDIPSLQLDPFSLADPSATQERRHQAQAAIELLGNAGLIISLPLPTPASSKLNGKDIVSGLAEVVAELMEQHRPGALILSGGDTAQAVLSKLDVSALHLLGEIIPGLVHSRACGGGLDGELVVTKAGAFGDPDALLKLYQLTIKEST